MFSIVILIIYIWAANVIIMSADALALFTGLCVVAAAISLKG